MGIYCQSVQWPLLLCILLLWSLAKEIQTLSPDGEALVNFRTAILSSDGVLQQWRPEDADPCLWKGVKCDRKSKKVISLSLSGHKLSGSLPPDIGKLDQLQFLALHDNNLYGTIPPDIGNCTKLVSLFLQSNFLSGVIPGELGNLAELQSLDLSSNSLSGNVPSSLGKLNKLALFNVSANFLVGSIPSDGYLSTFRNDSFMRNRDLCGQQVNKVCKGAGTTSSSNPSAVEEC